MSSDDSLAPGPYPLLTPAAGRQLRLDALAAAQGGVVGRTQVTELGFGRGYVRDQLRGHRWGRPYPRTYVTFTGPMPFPTQVWAAIVYAGGRALASHGTAAYLCGLSDIQPEVIEVVVEHGHRAGQRPRLRIRQTRLYAEKRHPTLLPPQTRVEDTVLDLTDAANDERFVIDVLLRACQRRLTTAARINLRAAGRKRMRWRQLVDDVLADVHEGVQSALERRYLRDVERAHGLPRGRRNAPEGRPSQRRYRDVRYLRYHLVVELDGRAAHPGEWKEKDDLRDNELLVAEGTVTLRYGWRAVTTEACATAGQVVRVLHANGWRGAMASCPNCRRP